MSFQAKNALHAAICAATLLTAAPAWAGEPCCAVVSVDTRSGIVSAQDRATQRRFEFKVENAILLRRIQPGQAVTADTASGKVTLDGIAGQYNIVAAAAGVAPAQPSPQAPTAGVIGAAPSPAPSLTRAPTAPAIAAAPSPLQPAQRPLTAPALGGSPTPTTTGQAGLQNQAQPINPEVLGLSMASDLVATDLGLTSLGEITFNLVNRGEVGVNAPVNAAGQRGAGAVLATQAPAAPPGPPIRIDIYIGSSMIKSVFQPSIGGKQTKIFKENIPATLPKPKCLETRNLKVVVDPQNQVKEFRDDNNVTEAANSARPCPDLAIKSISRDYSGVAGETYSPKVTIVNQGNAPSPATQVWATSLPGSPWPVNGWPELVPVTTIPALAPGQTTSFHVGGSVLSSNRTAVRIILDRHHAIEESDESNNFKDERL